MKTLLTLILLTFTSLANANPLLGLWEKTNSKNVLVIKFEEGKMTQSSSRDMTKNPMSVDVKYVELDDAYGIELLDEKGKKVAAMMAFFKEDDVITFGAPGSVFFELQRVKQGD